ncbi:MAG: HAD family hydrolase [Bacteroidota bacterium]
MSQNLEGIQNLIFDFGGVIIDIDYEAVRKAFEDIGMQDVQSFYKHDDHSKLVKDMETGLLSENDFRDTIIQKIGLDLSYEKFDSAWNAIIKDVPAERVQLLEELSKHFRLYLLSNTNIIHYRKYTDDFEKKYGKSLRDMFKKAYFSHEIKLRKPDKSIFTWVLNDAGIKAENSMFIDDSEINIQAAEEVGLKTLYKPQHEELTDYFKKYL